MNFEAVKAAAEGCRADMSRFPRDMISFPSESCGEKDVVMCIKAGMEKPGFDKVEIDGLGNVTGRKQDLVNCAALYAAVPGLYRAEDKRTDVTQFRQSLTDNEIQ